MAGYDASLDLVIAEIGQIKSPNSKGVITVKIRSYNAGPPQVVFQREGGGNPFGARIAKFPVGLLGKIRKYTRKAATWAEENPGMLEEEKIKKLLAKQVKGKKNKDDDEESSSSDGEERGSKKSSGFHKVKKKKRN